MSEPVPRHQLVLAACKALEGSRAMSSAQLTAQLGELEGWRVESGAIEHTFRFNNYFETMAFLNAVAYVVHREDHHPDITFGYNSAQVRFNTHSVKGISLNDFICAAKCDAIYASRPGQNA